MVSKATRGDSLRAEITEAHNLDAAQLTILEEACRCADRLDALDALIRARGSASALDDGILGEARQQQNILKQLLVSLRLPDVTTGRRPQLRSARGAYQKSQGGASARDALRAVPS